MKDILLKNGKVAKHTGTRTARVKEVDPDNDINIYSYSVPCPYCEGVSPGFSYDGLFFANLQLTCRECGIFFRPMIDPKQIPDTSGQPAVAQPGTVPKPRFTPEEIEQRRQEIMKQQGR